MRDPKRIPKILKRLQKVWKKNPDLRFSQLVYNVFYGDPYFNDPFYVEDDKFIKIIEEFYEHTT